MSVQNGPSRQVRLELHMSLCVASYLGEKLLQRALRAVRSHARIGQIVTYPDPKCEHESEWVYRRSSENANRVSHPIREQPKLHRYAKQYL